MITKINAYGNKQRKQNCESRFADLFASLIELLTKRRSNERYFRNLLGTIHTNIYKGKIGVVAMLCEIRTRDPRDHWTKINCKQCECA